MRIYSFPPIARADARILILGSMPGEASLKARQYYAYPRNAFWPVMGALFGAGPELPYEKRVARLIARKVAVWDVLKTCVRGGSLDSNIDKDTIILNDFVGFFERHRKIRRVYFNGSEGEKVFRRFVLPVLAERDGKLQFMRLPSTSPTHAAKNLAAKIKDWRVIVDR